MRDHARDLWAPGNHSNSCVLPAAHLSPMRRTSPRIWSASISTGTDTISYVHAYLSYERFKRPLRERRREHRACTQGGADKTHVPPISAWLPRDGLGPSTARAHTPQSERCGDDSRVKPDPGIPQTQTELSSWTCWWLGNLSLPDRAILLSKANEFTSNFVRASEMLACP